MTRRNVIVTAVVVLLFVGLLSLAVARIVHHTSAILSRADVDVDSNVMLVVVALLVFPAYVAGQLKRGIGHGRGIIRSHIAAIHGIGIAALMALAAVVLFLGGAR